MNKAYKLFRIRKDGSLGTLFINRKMRVPINEWLVAESHPTKGYTYRPFWHCTSNPIAPHLSMKGRAWFEVEMCDFTEFSRPKSQGGLWFLAKKIKVLNRIDNVQK